MGKFHLSVRGKFDAAHYLEGYQGACANMHGHTWKVEAVFEGGKLDRLGMIVDFKFLKKEMTKIIGEFDHHCVNYILPKEQNPTAENIAKWIFGRLKKAVKSYSVALNVVMVWESDDAWASYSE